ncbi:hypothetical protein BC829DRAFT_230474 [Chytridium lagenaria]|nr:hypothetical protein BC829DRAFT_230474 [Chytridium lagenaria]
MIHDLPTTSPQSLPRTSQTVVTKSVDPSPVRTSTTPAVKKETIPFDQVLEKLKDLPKPVAAPRSARTLKKVVKEEDGVADKSDQLPPKVLEKEAENTAPVKETVAFDQVLEKLKDLPKPVAAPRSARTLKRVEAASKEETEKPVETVKSVEAEKHVEAIISDEVGKFVETPRSERTLKKRIRMLSRSYK